MKRKIVVKGDPLSNGGSVTDGSGFTIDGLAVALEGDPTFCPLPLHGKGKITKGSGTKVNDVSIALEGDPVSCGCTVIAATVGENAYFLEGTEKECKEDESEEIFLIEIQKKLYKKIDEIISKETKEKVCILYNNEYSGTHKKLKKINISTSGRPNYGAEFINSLKANWCNYKGGTKLKCATKSQRPQKQAQNNMLQLLSHQKSWIVHKTNIMLAYTKRQNYQLAMD